MRSQLSMGCIPHKLRNGKNKPLMAYLKSSLLNPVSEKKARKRLSPRSISKSVNSKCRLTGWKKNQSFSIEEKRALIEPEHQELSIAQQCKLLGLPRSSYYYEPRGESEEHLLLMRLLDEQYTRT